MKSNLLYIFIMLSLSLFAQTEDYDIGKLVIEEDALPAVPPLSVQKQHSVYDYAGLLKPDERKRLEQKLSKYYDSTSTQIVVATINKVNDDISLYATEWAHKWGIGQEGKDNGVFILVSKEDRKITISTGFGVEHLLTDALSRRIIENDIIPAFKQGKYYEGLDKAVTHIQKILAGEFVNDLSQDDEEVPWVLVIIIIILIIYLISLLFKDGGSWNSTGSGPIIISRKGRTVWGGSGSSGGLFGGGGSFGGGGFSGGFGGGGFGGGGATGSW